MMIFSLMGDIMKRIKLVICILALLVFSIIAYLVLNDKTKLFDQFIYECITFRSNDFFTGFYKFITFFASTTMVILISLMFLLIFKNKKYGLFCFENAINIVILNIILKLIFMRDRPYDLMLIDEVGYSFPSGHAMAALGFYGFIIYLIWQFNLDKKVKIIYTSLLCVLIILIGVSRIYLGVHYPSDVLAGYMISIFYLILFITYIKKYLKV